MLVRLLFVLASALAVAAAAAVYTINQRSNDARSADVAAPSVYTASNAADVFAHPEDHLGAHVDLTGEVVRSTPTRHGQVLAMRASGDAFAVHVFDRSFRAETADRVRVVGTVRGPLGDEQVPGVEPGPGLRRGTAVIDAEAASMLRP